MTDFLAKARLDHIEHRQHHELVPVEGFLHADDVGIHAAAAQLLMQGAGGLAQVLLLDLHAPGIFQRPAAVPVKNQGGFCAGQAADYRRQRVERGICVGHIFKDAGVIATIVVYHRAVPLLSAAAALAPLEILHAVTAAGHRLQALQAVDAWAFELVVVMPVDKARSALHREEGHIPLAAANQRVVERRHGKGGGDAAVGAAPVGVAVPADKKSSSFCSTW